MSGYILTPKHRAQRSADIKRFLATLTPEQRSERARHAAMSSTPEQRRLRGREAKMLGQTPEERRDNSRKASAAMWEKTYATPGMLDQIRERKRHKWWSMTNDERLALRAKLDAGRARRFAAERKMREEAAAYRRIMAIMEDPNGSNS